MSAEEPPVAARGLLSRVAGFGVVSLLGLAVDCLLFTLLVAGGASPLVANLISAATAVSLVFALSTRRVFRYRGRRLLGRYLIYLAYQAAAVVAASAAVAWLCAASGGPPLACKLLLLPLTFAANFLVMRRLTRQGGS